MRRIWRVDEGGWMGMCVAVPLRVKELKGNRAVLESSGLLMEADVSLVPEVQPGDLLLIHAGFALARLEPAEAEEILLASGELIEAGFSL